MTISEYFIGRPVFATVLNLLLIVVGVLSYSKLATREYPNVSIPILTVSAFYPNASAELVESDVTFALEDVLGGITGLEKMTSSSREGGSRISLEFEAGTDIHQATSNVRDALSRVRGLLPKDVFDPIIEQQGLDAQAFFYLSMVGPKYSPAELTHLANLRIKNSLRSIKGVSQIMVFGPAYNITVRLDRLKLYSFGISPDVVTDALSKSNVSLPGGKFQDEIPISLDTALKTPKDFEDLILKKKGDTLIRLRDVADVVLSSDQNFRVRLSGEPGVVLGIVKSSDGNPLEISDAARAMMPQLQANLPEGVTLKVAADNSNFIRASLTNIRESILEAAVLVILVIFLFLSNLRSTLIPLLTIPVSMIGTFAFMFAFGFSVNTITLLAMALAVGLVVDDAIVVLENIHRHLEKGLSPFEAAKKGSREIGFAIIAMTLTLASVYAPIAFIGGTIGQLFIEFALTLAGAVILSGVVALTLSPMMCARILKPHQKEIFPKLARMIDGLAERYGRALGKVLGWPKTVAAATVVTFGVGTLLFIYLPREIAPKEDRGFVGYFVEPLVGKSMDSFDEYVKQVEDIALTINEAEEVFTFVDRNGATVVVGLNDWEARKQSANQIVEEMREKATVIPTVNAFAWSWDTGLPGVESSSGRQTELGMSIQTTGNYDDLFKHLERLKVELEKDGRLREISHDLRLEQPTFLARLNKPRLSLLGVTPYQVSKAFETMFHETQPTMFTKDGLRYNVFVTSQGRFFDVDELYVTNASGERISVGVLADLEQNVLPKELNHLNQMRAANVYASGQKGQSFDTSLKILAKKVEEIIPANMVVDFSGAAKMQARTAQVMAMLFGLAIIFIYCVLAIQFESFLDPLIVMLTVPLACTGALLTLWLAGQSLNIFTQIGLITLVGLITKHGILVVDFANHFLAEGKTKFEAASMAASLRLRPILMTTGAMLFGAVPLVLSLGAGAEARRAIGYVLVSGLASGTLLTLFVIPTIYVLVKKNPSPAGRERAG